MKNSVELCTAAGINVSKLQPMDVYQLAGKLIQDRELTARALNCGLHGAVLLAGSRKEAMAAMTPDELAALRKRVTGGQS